HDLQKLLGGCFEIGEQTNLLEHLRRKVLGLVHNQDCSLTGLITLQQPLVQLEQHLAFHPGFARNAEVGHHEIEELRDAEPRVKDKCCSHVFLMQPSEKLVQQSGFPGANLARQQDKAL